MPLHNVCRTLFFHLGNRQSADELPFWRVRRHSGCTTIILAPVVVEWAGKEIIRNTILRSTKRIMHNARHLRKNHHQSRTSMPPLKISVGLINDPIICVNVFGSNRWHPKCPRRFSFQSPHEIFDTFCYFRLGNIAAHLTPKTFFRKSPGLLPAEASPPPHNS